MHMLIFQSFTVRVKAKIMMKQQLSLIITNVYMVINVPLKLISPGLTADTKDHLLAHQSFVISCHLLCID